MKLLTYIVFEKYIFILALEMASSGNQRCANCIGTLSFPMHMQTVGPDKYNGSLYAPAEMRLVATITVATCLGSV